MELCRGDHKNNNGIFCFPYGGFIMCQYWLRYRACLNSAIISFKYLSLSLKSPKNKLQTLFSNESVFPNIFSYSKLFKRRYRLFGQTFTRHFLQPKQRS